MTDDITLRLDRATAEDLYVALYEFGEHIAAGAPIHEPRKLVNSGVVWAGLAVVSGWLVCRPAPAAAAGIVSLLTACVVHYGVGQALGMFDWGVWAANLHWLLAAMVMGGPLGLVGTITRRVDHWGMAARLVLPIGAVIEPFYLGRFTAPAILPWPDRVADAITGLVLLTAGVAGGFQVFVTGRRRRATAEQ